MTSRERVRAAAAFEKADRPPFNFWMDRRLMAQYEERLGPHYRAAHYEADVVETFPQIGFPCGSAVSKSGTTWVTAPLIDDMAKAVDVRLPNPDEADVCQLIREDLARFPDKFVILDMPGVLGIMSGIRLPENFFVDIYDRPEETRAFLERISDILVRVVQIACELPIDAVYAMDDIGTSKGLIASPAMLAEWVLGFNRRYIQAALEAGKPVWLHSDGNVMDALDMFVDMGVTVVNPLEPRLNDMPRFAREYHRTRKLAVYGALDTYGVIPSGTPDDVRRHVRETYELLGGDGGLIFSTHDIPLDTPLENVEALVDEIKRCG